jgi:hypothetical protein
MSRVRRHPTLIQQTAKSVVSIDATTTGMALLMSDGIEGASFAEGTRTGEWFAIGDSQPAPSVAPPPPVDVPRVSGARRTFVRVLGCLLIGSTLAFVGLLATHAPARRAILRWGLFGQSERILPAKAR